MKKNFTKLFVVSILLIGLVSCQQRDSHEDSYDYDLYSNMTYTSEIQSFEKGKSIARTALLIHLQRTKQIDTIRLDFYDILQIEDSLYQESKNPL